MVSGASHLTFFQPTKNNAFETISLWNSFYFWSNVIFNPIYKLKNLRLRSISFIHGDVYSLVNIHKIHLCDQHLRPGAEHWEPSRGPIVFLQLFLWYFYELFLF